MLACALGVVVFKSSGSGRHRQNRSEQSSSTEPQAGARGDVMRLSAPAKPAAGAGVKGGSSGTFEVASNANIQLQTGLSWSFGGRLQRGWGLYTPLISHLIGAGADATTGEFAMRLSLWQKENNLAPTGLLDAETWAQMVARFQSRRVKADRLSPDPNQLVTIPISDCYDPTRAEELRSVERQTFAAYKRMVAVAALDSSLGLEVSRDGQLASSEKFLKIISAFRSRKHQEQLRLQSPNSGRAGLAVNSPHFTGRALDLYVGGEPVSTKDENRLLQTQGAVYRWLVKNASRFGFQPYFYEPWHWEFVAATSDAARSTK